MWFQMLVFIAFGALSATWGHTRTRFGSVPPAERGRLSPARVIGILLILYGLHGLIRWALA